MKKPNSNHLNEIEEDFRIAYQVAENDASLVFTLLLFITSFTKLSTTLEDTSRIRVSTICGTFGSVAKTKITFSSIIKVQLKKTQSFFDFLAVFFLWNA
jgi:hypothetical protein